jgi:putative tryptophan/tyrosine transport system substrate-binding protein
MNRRSFSRAVVAVGVLAVPLANYSQAKEKIRRIGFLRVGNAPIPPLLVQGLRDRGWVEGRNIEFESRHANAPDAFPDANIPDELRTLALELVALKVDLIVTAGTWVTLMTKEAVNAIPIVFSVSSDPVANGLVASLNRPGGNLTGFALGIYDEKQLEVLKEAVPAISRVAYPVFRGNSSNLAAAAALRVRILDIAVDGPADFEPFFTTARKAGSDAALVPDIAILIPYLEQMGAAAFKSRLPSIGFRRVFAESGGLLSYAPMLSDQTVRMAEQIDKILRGAKPADLPVEQPRNFELVVNLRAAGSLGLRIPQTLLVRAHEVIR